MPIDKLKKARFNHLTLNEKIGEGGYAVVYRAQDIDNGETYAVKVLREEFAKDKEKIASMHNEFRTLQEIDHHYFPLVYEIGDVRDQCAFSMSLCPGQTLYSLRKQNMRFDVVGSWLAMIDATRKIHDLDLIHNDLKPENVLLEKNGHINLLDFGNVRSAVKTSLLKKCFKAKKKFLAGTFSYLAPEILEGKRPTKASDIYALGICAHSLMVGSTPFTIKPGIDGARQHLQMLHGSGIKGIASRAAIPSDLATTIDACCRLDPAGRPSDAEDLWQRARHFFSRPGSPKSGELSKALLPKDKVTQLFSN